MRTFSVLAELVLAAGSSDTVTILTLVKYRYGSRCIITRRCYRTVSSSVVDGVQMVISAVIRVVHHRFI